MKQDDTTARFDEQLLVAYFSGTTTAEEEQALLAWIRSSDDNRRTFAELRAVWQRGRMQRPDTQLQARFVRSLNSLNRRIDALGADAPLRRSRRIPLRRFAAAAIVAVALAAAFMTYRVATAPFVHRFHNADTVAMHVAMPDGTDVWLSPGTTLSYDDTFRIDGRNVELDGEAYFDVTHDAGQPFVVTAPAFRVRVLGTVFNVRSFSGEPVAEATLAEGSVALQHAGGRNLICLHPGQQAAHDEAVGHAAAVAHKAEFQYAEMVHDIKEQQKCVSKKQKNPRINKCKDFIFSHLHDRITLKDLAAEADCNPNYLSQLFRLFLY